MSTRAVIARKTPTGFTGVYHHWDGYPTGLGQTLFNLNKNQFKGKTADMLKVLIDDHPAGWSTINGADFNLEPGYQNSLDQNKPVPPSCYCHGARAEKGNSITEKTASACGCEWAYVFDGAGHMEVWCDYCDPKGKFAGQKMIGAFGCGDPKAVWRPIASVKLSDKKEPNFKKIEEKANA